MHKLSALLLLLPFFASSQLSDTIGELNHIFSLPSPVHTALILKDHPDVDESIFDISFQPTELENKRAMRAGMIVTHDSYRQYRDTFTLDSSLMNNDFAPIFNLDSVNYDHLQTSRAPSIGDSILSEYFLTVAAAREIRHNIDDIKLNHMLTIGSWVESLYFMSHVELKEHDKNLETRIGENGSNVDRVIGQLKAYNDPEFFTLVKQLEELQSTFGQITSKYKFKEPTLDREAQKTTFEHSQKTKVPKGTVQQIYNQLGAIRSTICN